MKELLILLAIAIFIISGCKDNESINEKPDNELNDEEIPDITSAIVFMDNFKAENGGYGQYYHEGKILAVEFRFWNRENNSDTCRTEFLSPEPEGSYMRVEGLMQLRILINGYQKGEYKIVKHDESDFYETDEKLVTIQACVWHEEELQPGFEDCYVPYSGTVTIDKDVPPTVKDSKNININLEIDADFPEESIRLIGCETIDGRDDDGEWISYEFCNCRADDGTNSTCEPSYRGERCCYNPDSKMVNYKLNLNADVCHLYCSVTTESVSDMEKCQP